MDSKHNIEKLGEKLEKCRNMKLEDVTSRWCRWIKFYKIDRRKSSNERILIF